MKRVLLPLLAAMIMIATGCYKGSYDNSYIGPEIIREWSRMVRTTNVIPAPANRTDTGTVLLQIRDDRSVIFQYDISGLAAGDFIEGGGIHLGNATTNGQQLLELRGRSGLAYNTGVITNIRQSLIDTLANPAISKYVLIRSTRFPNGLLRAQL